MRVDEDQMIGVVDVDVGKQRSTAFLHDEMDGVIHVGVG